MAISLESLPTNTEAWAFYTLVFGAFQAGLAYLFKWWLGRADKEHKRDDQMVDRYISYVEKQTEQCGTRLDASIAGMASLTAATNELASIARPMLEEIRRNQEGIRDLQRRP